MAILAMSPAPDVAPQPTPASGRGALGGAVVARRG